MHSNNPENVRRQDKHGKAANLNKVRQAGVHRRLLKNASNARLEIISALMMYLKKVNLNINHL